MLDLVTCISGVPVRLTDERWAHIVEEHNELAGLRLYDLEALSMSDKVVAGSAGNF